MEQKETPKEKTEAKNGDPWQHAGSKRKRNRKNRRNKKKRKLSNSIDSTSSANITEQFYGKDASAELEILNNTNVVKARDLQALILWVLGDGTNPKWVFVKNKPLINNFVILVLRSVSSDLLENNDGLSLLDSALFPHRLTYSCPGSKYHVSDSVSALLTCALSREETRKRKNSAKEAGLHIKDAFCEWRSQKSPKKPRKDALESTTTSSPDHAPETEDGVSENTGRVPEIEQYLLTRDDMKQNKFPLPPSPSSSPLIHITTNQLIPQSSAASSQQDFEGFLNSDDFPGTNPKLLGVDCEMCRTKLGLELTRVSIVNELHDVVYDELVKPKNPITDYLSAYSGITEQDLRNVTKTLEKVQKDILGKIIDSQTVLVGHSLENDLCALKMFHSRVIDTSLLYPHPNGPPAKQSLKALAAKFLKKNIQNGKTRGGHNSIEDARSALELAQLKLMKGPEFGEGVRGLYAGGSEEPDGVHLFRKVLLEKQDMTCIMVDVARENERTNLDQIKPIKNSAGGDVEARMKTIWCSEDEHVANEVIKSFSEKKEGESNETPPNTQLVIGQFRSIEDWFKKRNSMRRQKPEDPEEVQKRAEEAKALVKSVDEKVRRVRSALPHNALLMVVCDRGDLWEVMGLQHKRKQNPLDLELSKQLETAVESVRKGACFLTIEKKNSPI